MKVYYFGCMNGPGHYLHSNPPPNGLTEGRALSAIVRSNPWGTRIDGGLCPPGDQIEGRALVHHKDGWTAMSFWDRSVDRRGGSCSTFLAEGTHDFYAMMALGREHFPAVVARYSFVIYLT